MSSGVSSTRSDARRPPSSGLMVQLALPAHSSITTVSLTDARSFSATWSPQRSHRDRGATMGGVRALVQRVREAKVSVTASLDGTTTAEVVGSINSGLCVLVGVTHDDTVAHATKLADKLWNLRIIDDDNGVMNRSVADTTREILIVSQFTLYADTSAGRRPSYIAASRPEHAEPLIAAVVDHLRMLGATVATGRFRTEMHVSLVNDGPVTMMIEI